MSASLTFQPRKPTTDFNDDLNGDGIPDGAQVSMAKEITDNAGNKTRLTAKWNKGPTPPPAGIMGEPGTQSTATPPSEMGSTTPPGGTPPPRPPTAQEVFAERVDRNADKFGLGRSNTAERPVMAEDQAIALRREMNNGTNSVSDRRGAAAELDQLLGIQRDTANRELTMKQSNNQRDAAIAVNQGKQTIEQIRKSGKVEAAVVTGDSRVEAAGLTAEQRQAQADKTLQLERDKMTQRDRIEQMRLDAWKSRAADKATLSAAKDQQSREKAAKSYLDREFGDAFSKQSLRGYIQATRDTKTGGMLPDAKVDPVFESRLEDLNSEWTKATGKPYIGTEKQPASTEPMNPTNKAAYDWAKANPDDPRSSGILKKLGVQ